MLPGVAHMEEDAEFSDTLSDRSPTLSETRIFSTQEALEYLSLQLEGQDEYLRAPKAVSAHTWDQPLLRASRWRRDDAPHVFFHNLLKDLQLPTTRSKEVAKWRIRKTIADAARGGIPLPIRLPERYTQDMVGLDTS